MLNRCSGTFLYNYRQACVRVQVRSLLLCFCVSVTLRVKPGNSNEDFKGFVVRAKRPSQDTDELLGTKR